MSIEPTENGAMDTITQSIKKPLSEGMFGTASLILTLQKQVCLGELKLESQGQ